jgi:hypothetical protein
MDQYITDPEENARAIEFFKQQQAQRQQPEQAAYWPEQKSSTVREGSQWQPAGTSAFDRFTTGLADPIYGAGQLAENLILKPGASALGIPYEARMNDLVNQREQAYVPPSTAGERDTDWARMAGNVANPISWFAPEATIAGNVATRVLPRAMEALGSNAGRATTAGAMQGSMTPTPGDPNGFLGEKGRQILQGGAFGFGTNRVAAGLPKSVEAQQLMDQGIQPSVGQAMGGIVNKMEQGATSMPIVGDAAAMARRRPLDEFGQKVIERATNKMAKTLDEANRYASSLYDSVVPDLRPNFNTTMLVDQARTKWMGNPKLTPERRAAFQQEIDDAFANYSKLDGNGIKALDSHLGSIARRFGKSPNAMDHYVEDAIYEVRSALREGMKRGLRKDQQATMDEANRVYRELIPINKAASKRSDRVMMPRELQKQRARQSNREVTQMPRDDLVDPALAALPNNLPDSGTAYRSMLNLGTGAGAAGMGLLSPVLAAGAAGYAGATRPMQKILLGGTRAQQVAEPFTPLLSPFVAAALRGDYQE